MKKYNFGIVLILLFVAIFVGGCGGPPQVSVVKITPKILPLEITLPIELDVLYETTVLTHISGKIIPPFPENGTEVKKGDLLFAIDTTPYEEQLRQAMEMSANTVVLEEPTADSAQAQKLLAEGIITRIEYERIFAKNKKEVSSPSGVSKEAVAVARKALANAKAYAPFAGRIWSVDIGLDGLVIANNPVLRIQQTSPLIGKVLLPLAFADVLREAQKEKSLIVELQGPTTKVYGELTNISEPITADACLGQLRFDNVQGELKIDTTYKVSLQTQTEISLLTIPKTAVVQDGFVYIVDEFGIVSMKSVLLGGEIGDEVIALGGLEIGVNVISVPSENLEIGMKVEIKT